MKTFKISRHGNPIASTEPLKFNVNELYLSGNNLCLILTKEEAYGLCVGGKLHLVKYATGNDDQRIKVCDDDVVINGLVVNDNSVEVYFEYTYINPLHITSFAKLGGGTYKYKLYFSSETLLSPDDFDIYQRHQGAYKAYVRNSAGDIMELNGLALSYPYELVKGEMISGSDGYCCDQNDTCFNYETMEKNGLLVTSMKKLSGNLFEPSVGDELLLATNPYYYTVTENGKDNVYLYNGTKTTTKEGRTCTRAVSTYIEKYTDFLDLGVTLEQDYDAKRMFQEYQVNELFVKKVKSSIIPDFIDLEKIKYAPAFFEVRPNEETEEDTGDTKTTVYLATGLTFNLHFRSRDIVDIEDPDYVNRYIFNDTWYLNDSVDTWNGNGYSDGTEENEQLNTVTQSDLYHDENFVNSSNLIGYLDFTDDDVYNQKNRVKQTFIRLSFYDSDSPLTQNLLYYSTIFMDSGDLYGKYVKRKAMLEDLALENGEEYDETKYPVVWSPVSSADTVSAVTSQFTVNDEYDMTKSGEGFNLYLFRQDAPIENYPQDIYMKVEFNHAGNGRTIPLIFWPKDTGGTPVDLTIENYLKYRYIRVRIALTDRGYVYSFPDITEVIEDEEDQQAKEMSRCNGILWENERIVFNLFEPRITPPDFN